MKLGTDMDWSLGEDFLCRKIPQFPWDSGKSAIAIFNIRNLESLYQFWKMERQGNTFYDSRGICNNRNSRGRNRGNKSS